MLGFALALIYLCVRVSDFANPSVEPFLDEHVASGFGHFEVATERRLVKSLQAVQTASGIAVFVAHAFAIERRMWAMHFIRAWNAVGSSVVIDGCSMRCPLADGSFAVGISSSGGTNWLRLNLLSVGVDPMVRNRVS